MRKLINSTRVFRVLELEDLLPEAVRHDGIKLDPTKVTIDISGCGYTVEDLQKTLFERFNIQVEKSTFNTLTLLLTIGTTRSKVSRLYDALMRIARERLAPRRLVQTPKSRRSPGCGSCPRRLLLRRRADPRIRRPRARQPPPRRTHRGGPDRALPARHSGAGAGTADHQEDRRLPRRPAPLAQAHGMHGVVHEGYLPCIRVLRPEEEKTLPPALGHGLVDAARRRGVVQCEAWNALTPSPVRACRAGEHSRRAQRVAFTHHGIRGAVLVQPGKGAIIGEQLVEPHRLRAAAHAHRVHLARGAELVLDRLVGVFAHQDAGPYSLLRCSMREPGSPRRRPCN